MSVAHSISVIIPVLNEQQNCSIILPYLKYVLQMEDLIVVDGGSSDETLKIAEQYAEVVQSSPGRGIQMNTGVKKAKGDIYWFLHADCLPHPRSIDAIRHTLSDSSIVGGGFEYRLDGSGFIYRITEYFSNRKNKLFSLLYGDMGIFVRRDIFDQIGGFQSVPLMEDVIFAQKLRKLGSIAIIPLPIMTSARRWQEEGAVKNIVRNWLLQIGFAIGISPTTLVKYYRFGNSRSTKS